MPGMEPAGVEPIDDIQHEPDQSPRWQPLPQRGRHQELLITINRTIRTSHAPVFRESPQHSRTPPGDLATASVTTAEIAPSPEDFPDASSDQLVPGSLVFTRPDGPVSLDDFRAWW